jgi:hypothetical protein
VVPRPSDHARDLDVRFGDFSVGGTDHFLRINRGQLILVGEPQRFTGLQCVRPVTDHLWRVAGLGVFSARACRHSNQSLLAPPIPAGKRFSEGRDGAGIFGHGGPFHASVYGITESPAERLRPKDIVGKKVVRQRVLSDAELRALWRAAEGTPYPYGPLFLMLALTGQRKSEVAEARWREFDLEKGLWTIPPERMKMDAPHLVPLAEDVVAILGSLPRFKKGDYLFSTTFGAKPVNGFSKSKARLGVGRLAASRMAAHDPGR